MNNNKSYDVFLSYSAQDKEWVEQFEEALNESGIHAWFDVANIEPGEHWRNHIEKALRESKALIVILSPNTIESPWMFFELGAAVAGEKRIIPVLTQDMEWKNIPLPLTRYQYVKAESPTDAGKRVAQVILQPKAAQHQYSS